MVGNATFTIVVSMIAMNMATTNTTLTVLLGLIRVMQSESRYSAAVARCLFPAPHRHSDSS